LDNRFYRPELDIVRLIAFLAVFFHHITPRIANTRKEVFVGAAGYGLPLFFVLSAYLITTLLLREKQRTGKIAIAKFYQRRMQSSLEICIAEHEGCGKEPAPVAWKRASWCY